MKILVVDDDPVLCEAIAIALAQQGYGVDIAADGEAGWRLTQLIDYDLIILEVELPKLSGIQLCQRLRAHQKSTLILMLTVHTSSNDKIRGLDAGADEYVTKPISVPELGAHIRALLRRRNIAIETILAWGDLTLNLSSHEVKYKEESLTVTAKEYAILELLLRNPQRVFNQGAILNQIWSFENDLPGEETVRAHIKRIRQRLRSVGAEDLIETVYGLGYRLNAAFQNVLSSKSLATSSEVQQSTTIAGEPFSLDSLKLDLLKRLSQLENLLKSQSQSISPLKIQQEIQQEAHRLIGSLGLLKLSNSLKIIQNIEMQAREDVLEPAFFESDLALIRTEIEAVRVPFLSSEKPTGTPYAKILIVDDDRITLKLVQKLLEPWGLQVITIERSQQIWKVLETFHPDLLILDVQMPDVSGIDLCQQMRNNDRWLWLPILFLTGQKDSETIQQIFAAGADDYVSKPVVAPELIARLFNRLDRFRRLKQ